MARKSRSKQRGKGVGSKSQSAGKSKGGSRSSAGKSGGNKSGSGAKGGSKGKSTSSKSGRSKSTNTSKKSTSPARSNRGAPSPSPKAAPAPKKPTLTGPGMGPRGKLGTAQSQAVRARFKAREAAGLSGLTGGQKGDKSKGTTTIGNYRAAQKQQVQNAARIRNEKFKAEQAAKAAAKKKAADEKQARQFDSARLSPQNQLASFNSTLFTNPAVQNFGQNFGNWYNLGKDTRIPNEATARYGKIGDLFARDTSKVDARTLFGDDRLQRGMSNRAFKEGKQSGIFGRPDRAFGVDLGESFKQRKLVRVPAVEGGPMSGPTPVQRRLISDAFSIGKFIANPKMGILAALAKPTALADGTLTGQPTRFDTQAGGLNIGSTVDSGEASDKPSGLARVITGAADKVMRDTTDFDRRGKEKNFLADAFTQANTALKTVKPYFDAAKGQDDKSIRKQMSNLVTDIGAREELAPIARGIEAARTDNPNVPNRFGMETLSDIKDAFTPGKPKIPSIDPKSGIVMSIGNRMLAGDLKNIVKEADQQTGVEKGATRTLGQTINVAKQIGKNLGDTTTQGYQSAQKIAKLTGTGSGKPTPGSIIRGVNPFSRSGRGGSTRSVPLSRAGGTNPNTLALLPQQQQQQTPAEQFTVPQIPQQQGLDAGNLANVQNQSYQNTFRNLMAINPNYSARFQMRPRRNVRRGNFRSMFSRDYF